MATERTTGIFDAEFRLRKIDRIGDPLQKLDDLINWEMFRPILTKGFAKDEPPKGPGGRPPFDYVLRFKVLVLQSLYNLSDDAMEYQLNDRRTFQRFIGLDDKDAIPDAKSVWAWRELLVRRKKLHKLFDRFWAHLDKSGIAANSGSIIDASFVDKPRQRNTKEENDSIKEGKVPEDWQKPENEAKLRQKDTDARWTKKNNETHYGFKNHVKVDRNTKLIRKAVVTEASVHDSQTLKDLVDETDAGTTVYADSAYSGQEQLEEIRKKEGIPKVNEQGRRNKPLTKKQMDRNRKLSRIRSRVEHVFAFMTMSMGGMVVRCVGLARAEAAIILKNLAYNMRRYCVLKRA
jgi:IS5 family transposase